MPAPPCTAIAAVARRRRAACRMRRCRAPSRMCIVVARPAVEANDLEASDTRLPARASAVRGALAVKRMRPVASTSWTPSTNGNRPSRPARMLRLRRPTSIASGRIAGPVTGIAGWPAVDPVTAGALVADSPLAPPVLAAEGGSATANGALTPVRPPVVTVIRSSARAAGIVAVVVLTPPTKLAGAAGVSVPVASDHRPRAVVAGHDAMAGVQDTRGHG